MKFINNNPFSLMRKISFPIFLLLIVQQSNLNAQNITQLSFSNESELMDANDVKIEIKGLGSGVVNAQ
jgi:hypothetical protein